MGTGRWRIAVAILGGTGWAWAFVLPRLRDMSLNPDIVPSWHWMALAAVSLVLLVIDVGAIWYWFFGSSDDERPDGSGPGRPADQARRRSEW